ncbi:hypothetical protein [Parasphingorhabdus sp.]|jgi:hypothetical protein|uniref:hypothetical protein n=1 Tax=Parasphingorhabdus sp. TaxID=2709688 RepID=UPI0039E65F3D
MTPIAIASVLAFNLICSGQEISGAKDIGPKQETYSSIYRVDLGSQKWCEGDCERQRNIFLVTDYEITLTDEYEVERNGSDERKVETIDRTNGRHTLDYASHSPLIGEFTFKRVGACHKSEFTGFPAPKQKF